MLIIYVMNFSLRGAICKYREIIEILIDPLIFFGGWLACAHDILNRLDILFLESVKMMVEYEYG